MYFTRKLTLSLCLTTLLLIGSTAVASAHQPYFEGDDWTARKPWTVKDPTVSTALTPRWTAATTWTTWPSPARRVSPSSWASRSRKSMARTNLRRPWR